SRASQSIAAVNGVPSALMLTGGCAPRPRFPAGACPRGAAPGAAPPAGAPPRAAGGTGGPSARITNPYDAISERNSGKVRPFLTQAPSPQTTTGYFDGPSVAGR